MGGVCSDNMSGLLSTRYTKRKNIYISQPTLANAYDVLNIDKISNMQFDDFFLSENNDSEEVINRNYSLLEAYFL